MVGARHRDLPVIPVDSTRSTETNRYGGLVERAWLLSLLVSTLGACLGPAPISEVEIEPTLSELGGTISVHLRTADANLCVDAMARVFIDGNEAVETATTTCRRVTYVASLLEGDVVRIGSGRPVRIQVESDGVLSDFDVAQLVEQHEPGGVYTKVTPSSSRWDPAPLDENGSALVVAGPLGLELPIAVGDWARQGFIFDDSAGQRIRQSTQVSTLTPLPQGTLGVQPSSLVDRQAEGSVRVGMRLAGPPPTESLCTGPLNCTVVVTWQNFEYLLTVLPDTN